MGNRWKIIWCGVMLTAAFTGYSQEKKVHFELREEEMTSEELAGGDAFRDDVQDQQPPTVYLVNGKLLSRNDADNELTLWNADRVKVLNCTRRLPGGERMKVRYLIFKKQKRYRPHLEGNVAGYGWSSFSEEERRNRDKYENLPHFIGRYILYEEYDSVRRATGAKSVTDRSVKWNSLPRNVLYLLDGKRVKTDALEFLDGLIVKSLNFLPPEQAVAKYGEEGRNGAFEAQLFPKRMPLIMFDDKPMWFSAWLKYCTNTEANWQLSPLGGGMNYRFLSPVDAVERYGKKGIYGCIYVRSY